MVAWFTVVVGVNGPRQPVSFLFPHSGMMKRGGNNKETTSLVVLASDTNISYATMATTLSVYSPNCHDIARISLRNEVVCNSVHCRFNNLINDQRQAAQTIHSGFSCQGKFTFTSIACLPQCRQSCIKGTCYV